MANIKIKAKRGDLVLITRIGSYTTLNGPTTGTVTYSLAKVTSVNREGLVKAAERPQHCPWPWKFGGEREFRVVAAAKVGGDVENLLATLGQTTDFDTVEDAISVLRMEIARRVPATA